MSLRGRTVLTLGLLLLYWLAFVWLGIDWAHNPGFVMHRETVPYPVRDVVIVSGFVALLVAALGLVLLWPSSWNRWARVGLIVVYVMFLLFLLTAGMVTDMPGIFYVLPAFARATLVLLGALGLWRAGSGVRSSPSVV